MNAKTSFSWFADGMPSPARTRLGPTDSTPPRVSPPDHGAADVADAPEDGG